MSKGLASSFRNFFASVVERVAPRPTAARTYSVYIADGIDEEFVAKALLFVPGCFRFYHIDREPRCYAFGGEWARFLVPIDPNTLVVFDGNKRNARYGGGTIGSSAGVAKFRDDTDAFGFGLRIWHELLHTLALDADGMCRNPEFDAWLEPQIRETFVVDKPRYQHSAQYQALYYNFLLLAAVGRPTGAGESNR